MPDILIRITGQNSASAAISQAASSLSALERAMTGVSSGGSRVESALRRAASAQSSLVSAMNAVSAAQARVTSEGNRAALALDNYTRLSERLNNATGDTTRLQDQVQRAFGTSTTAADRYAESLTKLANANATLDQRQQRVQTTTKNLNEPAVPAEPSKSGSGFGAQIGGALKNTVLYGGVYAGGYALAGAAQQSLTRNAQYSRLLGTTQGFTGGSPADSAEINRYVQGLAGQGTLPYSPLQLLTSYYGLASADLTGGTKATERIATRNAQVAAASGDVDPTGTNQAILALIGAYNQNGPNVASFANTDLNQLTAGVIKGQLTFSDFASVIPRAKASIGKAAGVSSGDLIAYLSAESNVGISADQGAKDFGSLVQQLVRPNSIQQRYAQRGHIDLSSGFLQRDGGLSGFLSILQNSTAGLTEPQRATFFAGLLDNKAAGGGLAAVLGDTKNAGIFPYVANANAAYGGRGAAQAAIDAYNATPGAKLANAQAQFNTELDAATKSALPAFTDALHGAAIALSGLDRYLNLVPKKGTAGALNDVLGTQNLPDWMQSVGGFVDKIIPEDYGSPAKTAFTPSVRVSSVTAALRDTPPAGSAIRRTTALSSGISASTAGVEAIFPLRSIQASISSAVTTAAKVSGTSAADNQRLALAGVAAATHSATTTAVRTATARTAHFINAPGVGALEAGAGSTAVRFAGQLDPEATEIRTLRTLLQASQQREALDNQRIISLLAQIANQNKHIQSYPPNKQVSVGGARGYKT